MESIRRKTLLYRSGLGFWCANHVLGCSHGCRYPCYAYLLARRHGRTRSELEWRRPKLVANAVELLDGELARMRYRTRVERVHLCLTTDPFMVGHPEVTSLSLALVERLNAHRVGASVLTKGLLPPELASAPFDRRRNTLGISLVSLDETFRQRFEPGAARYHDRIAALERLHAAGCRTLVHIEPYPTAAIVRQDLEALLDAVRFVDELYFGGWNYSRLPGTASECQAFYRSQAGVVRAFCARRGIRASIGC